MSPTEKNENLQCDGIQSEILKCYKNSTIFLTGATGFLGRMILEKLLRTAGDDLQQIYILLRSKKEKTVQQRLDDIIKGACFNPLKEKYPDFIQKITIINGDCSQPNLGLNEQDIDRLINDVDYVIHCAATVRFDEKLRTATYINVRSVRDLIAIGQQMKHLKGFLYVSTAYSNCIRTNVDEIIYESTITMKKLLSLLDALNDEQIAAILPTILGTYPNTYVYTKNLAENVIKLDGTGLPIAIFRPSIVVGSFKEPVPGWIDNYYGLTGILIGVAVGLIRTAQVNPRLKSDTVPADYVVNCALATLWDVANQNQIKIFNFVSSPQAPLTWGDCVALSEKHALQVPSPVVVWHHFFKLRPNAFCNAFALFFLHTIPAYVVDFLAICLGRKPILVKSYQKINKFLYVLSYFATKEWEFTNKNVQKLWLNMNEYDQNLYEFNMNNFNWDNYYYNYIRGARLYLLKDTPDTIPAGRIKYYKLMFAHYFLLIIIAYLIYYLLTIFYNCLF